MGRLNARPRREVLIEGDSLVMEYGTVLWPSDSSHDEVVAALESLEDPYRSAIEMRFWGRMTYQAIAEEIGWPDRRWAAVYIRRGLNRLMALLEE